MIKKICFSLSSELEHPDFDKEMIVKDIVFERDDEFNVIFKIWKGCETVIFDSCEFKNNFDDSIKSTDS